MCTERKATGLFVLASFLFATMTSYQYCFQILDHRPVIVKRAVIGPKGGWKLSTIFLSCKVFHDWSIIKLGNILFFRGVYLCCTF